MEPKTFALEMTPVTNKRTGWRTFEYSTTSTSASSSRGSAASNVYLLQPVLWLNKAVEAAKERMAFLDVAREEVLPEGHKDLVIPYKKKYLARGSWESSSAEYAAGSQVPQTQINTNEGVQFTPARENYMVGITNYNIRTNALNVVQDAREELSYRYEDRIDTGISGALQAATAMSNTVWGMQTIFGGDATSAANNIDAGDIITTDMIAKARRLLMSDKGYYWTGDVWTVSGVTKNAWVPTGDEPFVLFVAPEQAEALLKDPQFTNAAEYGSDKVVLTGEIGQYLGVRVVETTKVPAVAAAGTITFQGGTVAEDVACHECFLVKAKKAVGIVYGQKAEIKVFPYDVEDKVMVKLSMEYHAKAIHADAIVRLVVADE